LKIGLRALKTEIHLNMVVESIVFYSPEARVSFNVMKYPSTPPKTELKNAIMLFEPDLLDHLLRTNLCSFFSSIKFKKK